MRKLSQRRAMEMSINNWHRNAPFSESVRSTAGFLWLLVLVLIFGSCAAGIVAGWPKGEHDADDRAGAVLNGPGEQRHESNAGGEGQDVGHAPTVSQPNAQKHVHGGVR